jgi:hypothetical protein
LKKILEGEIEGERRTIGEGEEFEEEMFEFHSRVLRWTRSLRH